VRRYHTGARLTGTTRRSQYRVLVLSRPVVQDDPAVCTVTRRRPREPFHHGPHVVPHLELDVPQTQPIRSTAVLAHSSLHPSLCSAKIASALMLVASPTPTLPPPPPTTPRVPGGRPPRAAPLPPCLLVNPFHPFNSSFIARAPQQERPARPKGRCELDCKKRRRGEVVGEHIYRAADSERR
jgi:hypothetical protein